MEKERQPVLKEVQGCCGHKEIVINSSEFTIGRSLTSSFVIAKIQLSRSHCKIHKKNDIWNITDTSAYGTYVNYVKLKKNETVTLSEGDIIRLGPEPEKFVYQFSFNKARDEPPAKKRKPNTEIDDELKKTKLQENILKQQLKELEEKLRTKEKENIEMQEKLKQTEIDKMNEIKELKEKQEKEKIEFQKMLEDKEFNIRKQLENQLNDLRAAKEAIEKNIENELAKKESESCELINQLNSELGRIKQDLSTIGCKKQMLEDELNNLKEHDLKNEDAFSQARNDMLSNFSDVLETELQCPICNEMFIDTTTLNCKHTFCQFCIKEWRMKKNECPVCRTRITAQNQTLAVDNFIDKIVQSLPEDLRNKRNEIIKERRTNEKGKQCKKKQKVNNSRSRAQSIPTSAGTSTSTTSVITTTSTRVTRSRATTSTIETPVVELSSDSDSSSESEISDIDDSLNDSDFSNLEVFDDDLTIEYDGVPGAYYGGYGYCYTCGAPGHWANGCPNNPRRRIS